MGFRGHMQEWVDGLRRGEAEPWERLRSFVDGCVSRASPAFDSGERDEIACDTLSTVWETLSRLRDSEKLLAVVRTIARRLCSRRARSSHRYSTLRWDPEDPMVKPTCAPEAQELYDILVGSLEDSDRKLFRLLYVDGTYGAELGRREGAEYAALRKRKHLLNKKLRAALERYSAEDGTGSEESHWSGRIQDL